MKYSTWLKVLFLLLLSFETLALTFSVTPKGELPLSVPRFGKTSAYYTVKNTTNLTLNENFIKTLPKNVTQVTCDKKYCGKTFNLGAKGSASDSCVLKLTIKKPVHAMFKDLLVCRENGVTCDGTNERLKVTQGPSVPFLGIAAGGYSNHLGGFFPLLIATNNNGNTWNYPIEIFQNLDEKIDPNFSGGFLAGAACTGSQASSLCIAPGQWCRGPLCEQTFPLIAVGTSNTTDWSYPKSVFQNLQSRIDPDLTGGYLSAGACFGSGGNAVCIASGVYFKDQDVYFPLLALSSNGGKTWTYPSSIFKNLTSRIDPSFKKGALTSASCRQSSCDSVCIASGNFCTTDICNTLFPLVALSIDKGQTWTYPSSVFNNLTNNVDSSFESGSFTSSSCTGKGEDVICIATGSYSNGATTLPLLILSQNGGKNWSYPSSVLDDLANRIGHEFKGGFFNGASCSGNGKKAVCIAAGAFFTTSNATIPFLTVSRDGGDSWSYPDFIYTKLKTHVDANFTEGLFEGASCIGTGNKAICTAVGNYCNNQQVCFPLVALSSNGGKTWSYPSSVYSNLPIIIDPGFTRGFFNSVSCSGTEAYNFCSASGQYSNDQGGSFPLLAYSTNGGKNWSYPPYVFKNLTSTIDPTFAFGIFNKTATSGPSPLTQANTSSPR